MFIYCYSAYSPLSPPVYFVPKTEIISEIYFIQLVIFILSHCFDVSYNFHKDLVVICYKFYLNKLKKKKDFVILDSFFFWTNFTLFVKLYKFMSDSAIPQTVVTRLLCPWKSPWRKAGVIAIPFSGGSSQLTDWTQISCIAGRFFTSWATREALNCHCCCCC